MVERTRAFESSGRISSSVGSWYISLFRSLFSACGSLQILRSPFFFRAMTALLTQSVGYSTCAITFIGCILLSSIFKGSRRATRTRRVAATTGVMELSVLKCATPDNVPSSSPKTSSKLSSTEVLATVATCFRVSLFMVMTFVLWLALLPSKGARPLSSSTTMDFYWYRLLLAGFCSSTFASLIGITRVCVGQTLEVGVT